MGVEQVTDLTTLNQQLVAQFDATLTKLIQEYNPAINLESGVYHDQVLHLQAILQAANQTNINLVLQSNSLAQITANPALADTTVVNNLLSNFNLVRNPGAKATGSVTIVLSALQGVVIPASTVITINGLTYQPTTTFSARTSSQAVVSSSDVLITPVGNGTYSFAITVKATAVGSVYNVSRGSAATLSTNPTNFIKAFATGDFVGGLDAQTNAQLLSLLASGMAIKAWSNRVSDESLIRKQPAFANISNLSIIGFGDPEMTRDQHSIFPGSMGGRNDAYIRTQPLYATRPVNVIATLISKSGSVGTWQFSLGRNAAPGFYHVTGVLLPTEDPTDPGFGIISDERGFDITGLPYAPDIVTADEAVYTRFQTAVEQFVDTTTNVTSLPIGTTKAYIAVVQLMPLIAEIQDFLLERDVAPPMNDVLVRAPIPAYTSVSFTVNYNATTAAPSIAAIKNTVASAVNALNFPGQLPVSFINQVLHNLLPNLVSVTNANLVAQILKPDGTSAVIQDSSVITIPTDLTNNLSGRTAAFFLPPANVGVTLNAVNVPSV